MGNEDNKPIIRFNGFQESWIIRNYSSIFSFRTTNSYSRDNLNYNAGAVKNIHYGDIHTKFRTLFDLNYERVPFINDDVNILKVSSDNYCKVGDLIVADASENYNDIGKCIEIINLNEEKVLAGLHTFLARPLNGVVALGFTGYLVQSNFVRLQIKTIAQGTKVLSLSTKRLGEVKLIIPSLPEQQKIAAFLTAVDDKIQLLTKKKSLLEKYKKGVMQQIFNQKIRFKGSDGLDYLDWVEISLGEVCEIKSGNSPSKYNLSTEGAYPFLKVEELNNCIKYQTTSREYTSESHFLIPENCIIFPKRGAAILNNKVRINLKKVIIDSNLMSLIAISDVMYYEFLYYVIVFVKLFKIADTSSIPQINNKHIIPYLIQNPVIEEQTKIANFLSAIDDKINLVSKQIELTQQYKKGLLQQMFV